MNLNDLSAEDLARIDSICLAFESKVRDGQSPSIDTLVSEFGGDYAELLRQELLAIQAELTAAVQPKPIREPFAVASPPASPKDAFDSVDSSAPGGFPDAFVPETADPPPSAEPGSTGEPESTDEPGSTAQLGSAGEGVDAEEQVLDFPATDEADVQLPDTHSPDVQNATAERTPSEDTAQTDSPQGSADQESADRTPDQDSGDWVSAWPEALNAAAEPSADDAPVSSASKETAENELIADRQDPTEAQDPSEAQDPHGEPRSDQPSSDQPKEPESDVHLRPAIEVRPVPDENLSADQAYAAASASTLDVSALLPREGEMIGPYRIGQTIGKGGMGVVYAATDTRLNRLVAIKVLAVGGQKRAELTERFEREARAVAALSHPNIVELFDVGVENGLPYAVMEYLDGETLADRLERGSISVSETRRVGAQICDALAAAHQGGVIHRDLKPHNVMLIRRSGGGDGDGSLGLSSTNPSNSSPANETTIVKLVDFGLSRVPRDGFTDPSLDDDSQPTREGVILGTPGFMAPEQARGDSVTSAADIFSLGCILFESFYGKSAITGETVADRFASTLEGTPTPDPIRRRDDVPLADLIDECLRKAPSERPDSAGDLSVRLRSTTPQIDPIAANIELGYATGEILRRRFLTATAGGLVGAVVGGLAAPDHTRELQKIRRLAVLTLEDTSNRSSAPDHGLYVAPISDKELRRGDRLAALLVNQLSQIRSIAVTPYRPMVANEPAEYIKLGEQLQVDAFVAGSFYTETRGNADFANLNLTIVSARTGAQLWGKTIVSSASDNLLEQTKLAEDIAAAIGHGLTSSASEERPPDIESFGCLVDGMLHADPDSVAGLEKALMCLERAKNVDTSYADPHAAIALASITLAAQSDSEKSTDLIRTAREEIAYLENLRGGMLESIDARLANAMLAWQTLQRYEEADQELKELAMIAPNNWQVQHQLGLLQLTLGRQQLGRNALKVAKLLYPMSAIIKMDYARADWFAGNVEWAKNDARVVLNRVACPFAKGLLIDIHEHFRDFDKAAALHDNFAEPASPTEYFQERRKRVAEQPYGPFGPVLNEAILDVRMKTKLTEFELTALADQQPPMLPLLLAAHPAFNATQLLGRARDMLPKERSRNTL